MTRSQNLNRGQYVYLGSHLHRLGLPRRLIQLIRAGELMQKIEEAYQHLDVLNARLDAWEAANPAVAAATPWYEGREAWKASGRPRPPWYEALRWHEETNRVPIQTKEIYERLLCLNNPASVQRARNARKRAEALGSAS